MDHTGVGQGRSSNRPRSDPERRFLSILLFLWRLWGEIGNEQVGKRSIIPGQGCSDGSVGNRRETAPLGPFPEQDADPIENDISRFTC